MITGLTEENFASLSEELAAKYMEKYQVPEKPAESDSVNMEHCNRENRKRNQSDVSRARIPCQGKAISTSSIALQETIMQEYIPFLSRVLLEEKIISAPLRAAVRKGKEHFVCDSLLDLRLAAIQDKRKNESQKVRCYGGNRKNRINQPDNTLALIVL